MTSGLFKVFKWAAGYIFKCETKSMMLAKNISENENETFLIQSNILSYVYVFENFLRSSLL